LLTSPTWYVILKFLLGKSSILFSQQYFRTLNTRVSVVYVETWQGQNQAHIDGGRDISKAISSFNDYTSRKLFKIDKDTTQLLT
jgi:Reprolysin (M12B) family zinc metalloprotease